MEAAERTPGTIFKTWLADTGRTTVEVARAIGTSRQNLENFRDGRAGQPRYLDKLARVMGYTLDELLQLQDPPKAQEPTGRDYVMRLTDVERAMVLAGRAAASGEQPIVDRRVKDQPILDFPNRRSGGLRRISNLRGDAAYPAPAPIAKPKKEG